MGGLSIFLLAVIGYVAAMAPSITVGDAGEFCAAGTILGLAHSPGYPLYALIGKLVSVAVPWGNLAYRFNLISAVAAAAVVALVFSCARRLLPDSGTVHRSAAALAAAVLLACSPAFARSAVQAEVFAVNSLFAIGICWALAYRKTVLAVFLFALGLGNHHTLLFAGPVILWVLYAEGDWRRPAQGALLGAAFLLGLSVYLYLPVRSLQNPALDWGNPETLHNLWRVVSRADYGSLSLTIGEKMPRDAHTTAQQGLRFVAALAHQYTAAGLLFGCLGWYVAVRRNWRFFRQLLLGWLIAGPGFFLLANMPFTPEAEGILERFYILSNVLWAFPVAAGIWAACARLRSSIILPLTVSIAALAVCAVRLPAASWRGYYLACDYGRNLLKTLPPRALLFIDGGDDTFYSLAYLCFAEKRRPDIEIHDRGGLVFANIYGPDFRSLTKEEKEERRRTIERACAGLRPIYFSTFNQSIMPGVVLAPDGILFRPQAQAASNAYPCYHLRGLHKRYTDYRSNALAPVYPYFEGVHASSDPLPAWRYALARWPEAEWLAKNLSIEAAQRAYRAYAAGNLTEAQALYRQERAWSPKNVAPLVNLGVIAEQQNDPRTAETYYRQAMAEDPSYPEAYYSMAVLCWKQERWNDVVTYFEQLQAVRPDDPRVARYLPQALARARR